ERQSLKLVPATRRSRRDRTRHQRAFHTAELRRTKDIVTVGGLLADKVTSNESLYHFAEHSGARGLHRRAVSLEAGGRIFVQEQSGVGMASEDRCGARGR